MKIGVALYGNGMFGACGYGVLSTLRQIGLPVEAICASGTCAAAASCYASGMSAAETESLLNKLLPVKEQPGTGDAGPIERETAKALRKYGILQMDDYSTTLILTSVDLKSGKLCLAGPSGFTAQGDSTAILKGIKPSAAVAASMALPGRMKPLKWKGMRLCDAGIKTGLSAWPLRCLGMDRILAVSAGLAGQGAIGIAVSSIFKLSKPTADYLMEAKPPDHSGTNLADYFHAGEKAALENERAIVESLFFPIES